MDRADFAPDFAAEMETVEPVGLTPQVIHHAAAGMTLLLWRNTHTVETDAHANGSWHDSDMLRMNTRATEVFREALTDLCTPTADEDGGGALLAAMRNLCDLLPTEAMKDSLWDESHRKADFWGSAISAFGPDRVLTMFTRGPAGTFMTCDCDWWGHPDYPARIAWLAATMNPPAPETFTARALDRPWDLSDEQAEFIVDHRYD